MINKNFYPTPEPVARQMIHPYRIDHTTIILDPEGGKGNLLDVARQRLHRHYDPKDESDWRIIDNFYTCEIEPELRAVLGKKGYAVLADDFLAYFPRINFDLVIMNPPFDAAEDHLLHAWEILPEGGEIVCLMSATSFDGKNAKENAVINLISLYGSKENIGKAFANAERKTDVDVMLVRLAKGVSRIRKDEEINFAPTNDRADPEFDDDTGKELALTGFVNELVSNFDAAVNTFTEYRALRQKIARYEQAVIGHDYYRDSPLTKSDECDTPTGAYNSFLRELQATAWGRIMDHPALQSLLTERARKAMEDFRARQKRLDFNAINIEKMLTELVGKRDELMQGAILDAFDLLTEYHKDNRIEYEGWKSNKCWRVNHRCVLPYFVEWRGALGFSVSYRRDNKLNDVDRALCIISGKRYDEIRTATGALNDHFNTRRPTSGGQCESTFFEIKFWKKGTIHITFKDRELLTQFNYLAAKCKNWLPPADEPPAPRSPEPSETNTEAIPIYQEAML